MIGKTLVHYEITAEIGKGGMGEVYQAKDTKLGRDVAIKVLPEEFALDKDRVARFQREAKLLASLNHPNIAAIYGLEESEGTHFLVMELIEGDTLKDRIKSGPIPVEEALKLALQMAEALEAAHEKGVIHRDLKPANIKVTPDGKVKILDFGLAKAFVGDQKNLSPMDSPTISAAATQQGVILGTAAYMSPEQARGKPVDRRADIWAFGAVLYEMLTGKKAFTGGDVTDTLAAVLRSEPEWESLPPNLHWRLKELLERCLEKEAKDRYGSISDARVDIQKVLAGPSGVFAQPNVLAKPRKKLRLGLPWVAAIAILCLIVAGLVSWILKPSPSPEPKRAMRSAYELPEEQLFTKMGRPLVAVSSDGTKMAYVANSQLWLRDFNKLTAKPVQGSEENPTTPFFSPDGQWLGYWSTVDGQLKKIAVTGGTPVKLCRASNPYGVTWNADDSIIFGQEAGIMRVRADGGNTEVLIETGEGEQVHGPQILPGGEWVLFVLTSTTGITRWDEAQIVAQSLKSDERRKLYSGGSDARYVPTGHLVYALRNVLYAIAFDADNLKVTGGAVPVVEGLQRSGASLTGTANYGFSDTGMLVYVGGGADAVQEQLSLVWIDREGKEQPIAVPPDDYNNPRISNDGTRIAYNVTIGENVDIWVLDLVRKTTPTRLTFDEDIDVCPIWTPDDKRITFASNREGNFGVYWKAADGTGEAENLGTARDLMTFPASWSADAKSLALMENNQGFDIKMLLMQGEHTIKPLLHQKHNETQSQISPDGRWIAYQSDESGNYEVYVRSFPDVNKGTYQVSTNGGVEPRWSKEGRDLELFYRRGNVIMAALVKPTPTFRHETPKIRFRDIRDYSSMDMMTSWDISSDGNRVLTVKESTADSSTEGRYRQRIIIVTNWFEELKQRVPVD